MKSHQSSFLHIFLLMVVPTFHHIVTAKDVKTSVMSCRSCFAVSSCVDTACRNTYDINKRSNDDSKRKISSSYSPAIRSHRNSIPCDSRLMMIQEEYENGNNQKQKHFVDHSSSIGNDYGAGSMRINSSNCKKLMSSRRGAMMLVVSLFFLSETIAVPAPANAIPEQKSYSQNARNFERLNSGDASAGSVYDNDPKGFAARKRRAMQGCKNAIAREEVAAASADTKSLSEKECNQRVMESKEEGPDFMLKALQKLDCPSCPYGIATKRPKS